MKNGKIGFGLVGTGMAGLIHAREFPFVPGAELVAVCSRHADQARAFAESFGVRRWYTDYHDLIEDEEVEVVNVLLPTGQHRDVTVAAARAGRHVLVEKPLDISLERADEMIRVCREQRTKLGVIFQMRFGTVAARLKAAVSSGELGRVFLADAIDKSSRTPAYYQSAAWRGTRALEGGGCLMTQSIHIVDLLQVPSWVPSSRWLARSRPSNTTSRSRTRPRRSSGSSTGPWVSLKAPRQSSPRSSPASSCTGSAARSSPTPSTTRSSSGTWTGTMTASSSSSTSRWAISTIPGPTLKRGIATSCVTWSRPFGRTGTRVLTGEDARVSLAINMAIYESSRTGTQIDFTQPPWTLPPPPGVEARASRPGPDRAGR